MIRGIAATFLWACLAGAVGVGLFFVKHEVKDQETRLADLNTAIQRNHEEMHVLRAEWAYLNDPDRLRQLAEKHLGMQPIGANQITADLDSLPGANGMPAFAALPADRIQPAVAAAQPAPAAAQAEIARDEPAPPKATPAPVPVPRPQPARLSGRSRLATTAAPIRRLAAAGEPTQAAVFVLGGNEEAR